VQAIPGANAAFDSVLIGLAWMMYGWAGLVAVHDLTEAVITAARASNQAEIDQAAEIAARALVILGVTLFLKKLADRVKLKNATGPKQLDEPEPLPSSSRSTDRMTQASEASVEAARRTTAQEFYAQTGWSQSRIDSHLSGIDFNKDVQVVKLNSGQTVYQWVDPQRGIGQYFSPAGMTPDQLGINGDGRVLQSFVVSNRTSVLQTTAAPLTDTWSGPSPLLTSGGGTQWFALDNSVFSPAGSP
jgi:hypothetical protein